MDGDTIYDLLGKLYDRCRGPFDLWLAAQGLTVKGEQVTRVPEVPKGEVGFLWVFATLHLADAAGAASTMHIIVVPSGFLEDEPGTAAEMVFATTPADVDGVPSSIAVFSDAPPKKWLAHVETKLHKPLGQGYVCCTPSGPIG